MKLAVTGCNGSVGSRVVLAALEQGHTVVGIDSAQLPDVLKNLPEDQAPRFKFHEADLRDYDIATDLLRGCEGIVHLAAMRNPGDYHVAAHNTNVVLSWNILRAAAELGINRVAQASSVNVIPLVWTDLKDFEYFPLDEDHPTRVDEPYGLSKLICELQADTIVRRYPSMRIASLRLSWSLPRREYALRSDPERRKNDLWGYVQEDSAAEAFLLAVAGENGKWSGHERFFITASDTASDVPTMELYERYWKNVPIKEGKGLSGRKGFFDCSKAERLLGWVHKNPGE
ncbi:NAD(P)-binding protein [Dichomitus squalens]|uniref:NAD(P)-binding protein n=1 Tax=Dichomitus squalens TaxID=114155 RepID=A0A4Q9P784_9APHY|nr:NAD(P)-binding protein [Dichomitus squalens]TBU62918.1 NAD(P)-binding protein [Dichomitus squalens]